MNDKIVLTGRIFLSLIFIITAISNVTQFQSLQGYLAQLGLPFPGLLLICALVLEVLGSISIILGLFPKVGVALLLIFLVPATLIFHIHWSDTAELIQFLKNLGLMGGLLLILVLGPGKYSLNRR